MKKIFVIAVVGLFMLTMFSINAYAKELKIGYVDLQKVFTEYKETKKAEADLESEGKTKTEERKKKVESIRRLKDEMELLSDKGKEDKQSKMDESIKELQDFDRQTRNELIREREDMIKNISKDIDKVITEYGKKEGYDLIFNKAALLFEGEGLDVTNKIIEILNKSQ